MEEKKVRIVADSTCDLSRELLEQYDIQVIPLCIIMDDRSYYDGLEVKPEEIFEWAQKNRKIPKTSAVTFEKAGEILKPCLDQGQDVVFFGISEDMSTTCNVIRLLSDELQTDKIHVVNSMNLSTGIGLLVLRAAEMARQGSGAQEIMQEMESLRTQVKASFVVDTLTYLAMGGRCSGAAALVANTLKLHPCIEVKDGKMIVGKKYRGTLEKVIIKYVRDMEEKLKRADFRRVFITHSGVQPEIVDQVRSYLEGLGCFQSILETQAGGVISSHCGPGTLGVLYIIEEQNDAND